MAWIRTVEIAEADGALKRIYQAALGRAGKVFGIVKLQSLNAPVAQAGIQFYVRAMHGESPLSRTHREMIATVTSRANDCHY